MDFTYLMELAKTNAEKDKEDKRIKFSTKVSNAKKLSKPGPKVEAVSSLLSKIEKEKRKKDEEFLTKRNQLLALREKDKHSKKRVHTLINRTKGASKAVLEDAKDLTTAKGEEQCDEDDYGYESTISQQIFSKLQNTYSELPEDERLKFKKTQKSSIEDIKNRVMSSLKQTQEEQLGIRKRKRKRKSAAEKAEEEEDGFINDGDEYKKFESQSKKKHKENVEKKLDKKAQIDLIASSQKVDKYSNFKYKEKTSDKGYDKEKQVIKKEKKVKKTAPPPMSYEDLMKMALKKQAEPVPIVDPLKELIDKKEKPKKDDERPLTAKEKKEIEEERIRKLRKAGKLPPEKSNSKPKEKDSSPTEKDKEKDSKKPLKESSIKDKSASQPPPKTIDRSKYFALPRSENVPKQPSSLAKDVKSSKPKVDKLPPKREVVTQVKKPKLPPKEFPPPRFPKKPPPPPPQRRIIDSDEEEEYDSEMDDFIDDGDVEVDYSNEIAKLFKYDKSKYRDIDEDIDDMEASYTQLEKEEKISARIGLMEDLEDIKREEDEKKRKKLMKKRK